MRDATGALNDARAFGERVLWYSGRFLFLVGEQAELTTYRLADQPEGRQIVRTLGALESATELVAERIEGLDEERERLFRDLAREREAVLDGASARAIEALDAASERVRAEREAAMAAFFDTLRAERDRLFADLTQSGSALSDLVSESREAAEATRAMAGALTETGRAFDRVVARFDEDPTGEREPLEIADIRDSAIESRRAAEELTRALETGRELLESEAWEERVDALVGRLDEPAGATLERAFRVGLRLIAVLVAGGLLLLVAARLMWRRA